ncbi:hypothetical protein SteCoe_321 [Stentor coeruleus]|uniref:Uncharacterized protein n=1 Tax=Stentor coeruleus TaxID=5963 RepID=A0A1R2D4H8_9CILI|nr:hypothetical protein SteCoe_321 [Stentor coeruleus]
MFRGVQRALQHLNRTGLIYQPSRGIFGLKNIFTQLKHEWDHAMEPGEARHNMHTMEMTETELFDEDAHEVQAMVTNNTFDLDIMMGDTNPQRNFGTIDNPVLMFSANVGWRYVMCTGLNDEDEGFSHIGVWFILREGPIHRCSHCGQCFKLVNLKDEISEENDYYLEHYMPILEEEMGDDDDLVTRWTFHKFAEQYPALMPMQNSNSAYILVNADDHDRILTDPAYRMQKLQEGHYTLHNMHQALYEIEERILWQRGGYYPPVTYTKADYEDLLTSELGIRKLERIFEKVQRFQKRAITEPAGHDRREARMLERAEKRTQGHTYYINTSEMEQRYKDYYESEYDSENDLIEEQGDYEELFASGIFDFKNYEFVEEGTDMTVPAVESVFEKKIFRFKHRKWNEDPSTHFIRENRMIMRYLDRLKKRDPNVEIDTREINTKDPQFANKLSKYQDYILDEAVQQYKDYYESDTDDIHDFDHITPEEKQEFSSIFKDYAMPLGDNKAVITVPTREYNPNISVIQNLKEHYTDLRTRVMPELRKQIENVSSDDTVITKAKDFELASGVYKETQIEGLEQLFVQHQRESEEHAESPKYKE